MFSIKEVLPTPPPVEILDLGASPSAEPPIYKQLLETGLARVVGFDAFEDFSYNAAEQDRTGEYRTIVLGDGHPATLHVTKQRSASSLLAPNLELCRRFCRFEEALAVVDRREVETTRLDDLIGQLPTIDYVKSDLQGADLIVLQNGCRVLETALVVDVEVEFVEQYIGQPTFADIDRFLRSRGFVFHSFYEYGSLPLSGLPNGHEPPRCSRQWLWANGFWVRSMTHISGLAPIQLMKLATILHEVYRCFDFAHEALNMLGALDNSECAATYRARMSAGTR